MSDIAGIPYVEAEFDKDGMRINQVAIPDGTTDLYVMSHGWNENRQHARKLYTDFFTNFSAVTPAPRLQGRRLAIVGVIWPSKQFDELLALEGSGDAQGSMSMGDGDGVLGDKSKTALEQKLERMKDTFNNPAQQQALEEAKTLIEDLEEKVTVRAAFIKHIRSLLDPVAADNEDASDIFFKENPEDLMKSLRIDEEDAESEVKTGGGAAFVGEDTLPSSTGGEAGISDFFSGFKTAAMNALNFATYYVMKERSGKVGSKGVAPLLDRLAAQVQQIHLIGHSFGGRLVAASCARSTTEKIKSMTLLQAAFSHYGFSRSMGGFFRSVVDKKRVKGPILVTHTKNDKAVGIAYPLASRLAGQVAAALGDKNDKYGGIGRNGAQEMNPGEVITATLHFVGSPYSFEPGKFYNANSDAYIQSHSDVTRPEIAYAVSEASLVT